MHAAPMWIDDSPVLIGHGAADQGAAAGGGAARPRPDDRRLPAADAGVPPQREPNRVQEVSEISRGLKQLARELKVPVIALSPAVAWRRAAGSAEPRLSDLRESGSIEQDADVVIFLYRDGERTRTATSSCQGQGRKAPQRADRRGAAPVPQDEHALLHHGPRREVAAY